MRLILCDMGARCQFNRDGKCLKEIIKIKNGQCYLLLETCNDKMVKEVIEEGEWTKWESSDASEEATTST